MASFNPSTPKTHLSVSLKHTHVLRKERAGVMKIKSMFFYLPRPLELVVKFDLASRDLSFILSNFFHRKTKWLLFNQF